MVTLIEHGWVVPLDGRQVCIEDGSVAIDDTRIAAVGPARELAKRFAPERIVDARAKAVLPGFVNTHTHLIGGVNKGLTEDASGVSGGLFKIAMPPHYIYAQPADMYWLASMHALELLCTGTTTTNEVGKHEREIARVVRDTGLRAVMAENIRDSAVQDVRPGVVQRSFDRAAAEQCIDAASAFIDEWHGKAEGRITCRSARTRRTPVRKKHSYASRSSPSGAGSGCIPISRRYRASASTSNVPMARVPSGTSPTSVTCRHNWSPRTASSCRRRTWRYLPRAART